MANICPFVGTRFNPAKVGDLADVLAPPYDVISNGMRDALCARSEHNVVRIDFGKEESGDDDINNRYSRAAGLFAEWRAGGALVDDADPSLYIYAQDYTLPGGRAITRAGFYSAVELMDLGPEGVMPHERTFEGPKADRLKLTRATSANFSAIFALYTDEAGAVESLLAEQMTAKPWAEATTDDGITHRLWVVNDPGFVEAVQAALRDRPLYIADGHHRYETALNYAQERRGNGPRSGAPEPSDHTLMYLVNTENPGLEILPTHRVLHRDLAADVDEFRQEIGEHFDLRSAGVDWSNDPEAPSKLERALAEAGEARTAFAMLLPGGEATLLCLKADADLDAMIDDDMPHEKKGLDATILHAHVLNRCWIGNPDYDLDEEECAYVRDIGECLDLLRAKRHCVAFLMNATTMDQLKAISALGERMPQKSTYFFPKIATGIVLREIR